MLWYVPFERQIAGHRFLLREDLITDTPKQDVHQSDRSAAHDCVRMRVFVCEAEKESMT